MQSTRRTVKSTRKKDSKRALFMFSFLAPACLLYAVFVLWPLVQAFIISLYEWKGTSSDASSKQFVGIENFTKLFTMPEFWNALRHTIWILVVAGVAVMVISLGMAHLLQRETRAFKAMRSIYLIPQVLSLVVVGVIWLYVYSPKIGILKSILGAIGLKTLSETAWTADQRYVLPAITVAIVWQSIGFYIMLLSTGLKNIPKEVTESAMLDGARNLTMLRRITLPLMRPILRISVIYLLIGCLNTFAIVFIMSDGQRQDRTDVMLTLLYEQAFRQSNYGVATSIAIVNFVLIMALSLIIMRIFKKQPHEEAAI